MSTTTKYVIDARIEVDGPVDRNDVVGAIFGQTEGIFSSELDLRELQKTGRIGRIEITVSGQGNRAAGRIVVPTNLDKFSTSLVAAMIESIDRVGPYQAKVTIEKIEDARAEKRKKIVDRAKEILAVWEKQKVPEDDTVLRELEDTIVKTKVSEFEKLPAGPDVEAADEIIVVEGRADVINLLRYGFKNVIGVEGVKVPKSIENLTKRKRKVIAFLDGDRGGDLILRELMQASKIDFVARAPYGKEVEELTAREIAEALERPIPAEEAIRKLAAPTPERRREVPAELLGYLREIDGTLTAVLLNDAMQEVARVPVSELASKVGAEKTAKYVLFDGVVTQRLIDAAANVGEEVYLIGVRVGDVQKRHPNVHILTADDVAGGERAHVL